MPPSPLQVLGRRHGSGCSPRDHTAGCLRAGCRDPTAPMATPHHLHVVCSAAGARAATYCSRRRRGPCLAVHNPLWPMTQPFASLSWPAPHRSHPSMARDLAVVVTCAIARAPTSWRTRDEEIKRSSPLPPHPGGGRPHRTACRWMTSLPSPCTGGGCPHRHGAGAPLFRVDGGGRESSQPIGMLDLQQVVN
jgi:hypothetical protein